VGQPHKDWLFQETRRPSCSSETPMKPTTLRLPNSSQFFASPYSNNNNPNPSQLSPVPGPSQSYTSSDSETLLLPITPATLEKGRGGYPFPSENRNIQGRMRALSLRGGLGRRLIWVVAIGLSFLLLVHQKGDSVSLIRSSPRT
jgi:hypothetical protein